MCVGLDVVFFFKQKTAYEMRISDWSSDACSSDLLVPRRDGGIAYGLDNFAHIVHARMGGGVHLYDVDMPPFGYGLAGLAHAAGVDGGSAVSVRANAVQRLGNKARSGGLAYDAHASHQEGMGQASALDGVAQGPNHCVLAAQLREILKIGRAH